MRALGILVALSGAFIACKKQTAQAPTNVTVQAAKPAMACVAPASELENPKTCTPCHANVVAEFEQSMHGQAHHSLDPIYAAVRTARMKREGDAVPGNCARCHSPRDTKRPDSVVATHGVTCASCHNAERVKLDAGPSLAADGTVDTHADSKQRGAELITWLAPKLFRGPHDVAEGRAGIHANGPASPIIADGKTVCLACHTVETNPAGIPTCTTGLENAAADGPSCVSCHMPLVETPAGAVTTRTTHRSHQFIGPHRAWQNDDVTLFTQHLSLTASLAKQAAVVTLENRAGHRFPTGFPGRLALLRVTGLDASGNAVWQNFAAGKPPVESHPEAVFGKAFVDAEGKPTLAPFATKQVRDHFVAPNGKQTLTINVPATVKSLKAELVFYLIAPQAAQKLGLTGSLTEPRVLLSTRTP